MLQLQSFHNKAAKIISDLPVGSSASEALNKLKWKPLARRRAEHRAIFINKWLNNLFSHRFNIEFNKDKHDYNMIITIFSSPWFSCRIVELKELAESIFGHDFLNSFIGSLDQ